MGNFLVPNKLNGLVSLSSAPEVAATAPAGVVAQAVPVGAVVPKYGMTGAFLAPPEINDLPYLAPLAAPLVTLANVTAFAGTVFLAPRLFNGLPYLAPEIVPVQQSYGGARRSSSRSSARRSPAKTSPPPPPARYHSRSDEQLEAMLAAQLDDEEVVLAFLMELALV